MSRPVAEPDSADAVLPPGFAESVRKLAATAFAREPRVEVFLFGSRAAGRGDPRSDIDLGVDLGHPVDLETMSGLRDAFDDLPILQKVDIVDFATLDEAFRRVALERRVLLFERQAR
jgi:predicted nucleotidyltransferase